MAARVLDDLIREALAKQVKPKGRDRLGLAWRDVLHL